MKNVLKGLSLVAAVLVAGVALPDRPAAQTPAQAATGQTPARGRGAAPAAPAVEWMPGYVYPTNPQPPYMPPNTPLGTGPYKALMATEPGAEEFVVYYPADLKALGARKLPILVWGNGSCAYLGNRFRHFLTEISSHGYFVVAGGPMSAPDNGRSETVSMSQNNALRDPDAPPAPAAAPAPGPAAANGAAPRPQVTVELLSKGLDWALAENSRAGGKFSGRLDPAKVAVMGQSCGGGLAAQFGADKRVKTIGVWSGATMRTPEWRDTLKAPTLLITGDARYDIAFFWGLRDFEAMKKTQAPVFYAWRNNLTHLGTYRVADGGELAPIATAWLDWQLQGSQTAGAMFAGENCGLCTNSHWHVQKKNMK